ncbi:hypothetical protein LTR64_008693 [Lithohypha guttulata]|uniref:uncharacterized protein n=1 Tax=Lithohypha guttulata TaxID=1690604 RepID=UPI002DDED172|nr:hypothetical protein LTR51_008700 [Lithohypha guttulata]
MLQDRLSEAAIAFHRILEANNIPYGIFGGFAIACLGGARESKDVDCIAKVNKERLINIVDGRSGFVFVNQTRQDYVAFLWSDTPDRRNAVLLEVFVDQFPGSCYPLTNVPMGKVQVKGQNSGQQTISLLDPVLIFKGKLRAAALRSKFHDSADLRWLETRFSAQLATTVAQFDPVYVGLALRRYPELNNTFLRLGLDLQKAEAAVQSYSLDKLPAPQPGDVQKGLLRIPSNGP